VIEKIRFNQQSYLPLSVLIGDINGVRLINDAYGYTEGDRLIVETARILKSSCDSSSLLFRTGGDEFIVLMPNTSESKLSDIMRRIQHKCKLYNLNPENQAVQLNLSLGSATRVHMTQAIDKVIHQAMDSLHKNKILESKSYHSSILSSIQATMFAKSQNTEEHAERLSILCRMMGEQLDLSQTQMDELMLFAMLHDIGKIGIDDNVLNKPGRLSDDEWIIMKKHTEIGYRIALSSPELHSIANYILTHHEHWNGGGYPQGLKEDEIPLLSRILGLVDAYDAMTQDRVYRKALSKEEAINEILRNKGTQFDPHLTDLFIEIIQNNEEL
jgi:diguanylate cyclase (GGDEF)-like protein